MKHTLWLSLLLVFPVWSKAQSTYYSSLQDELRTKNGLSGGTWVFSNDETQALITAGFYGVTASPVLDITGQSFSKYRELNFNRAPANNPWDAGFVWNNTAAIRKGDVVLLSVWMRTTGTEKGKLNLFAERVNTYEKEVLLVAEPTNQWRRYMISFEAQFDYAIRGLSFGFHLAYKNQIIQVAAPSLLNFGRAYPLNKLPLQIYQGYGGSEPDAPWRAEAEQRIEKIRKADLSIVVKKLNGDPVSGAKVKVEMIDQAFRFGSAITANRIAGNNRQDFTYEQKILNFDGKGHGFNEVVFENDLKWDAWEERWFVSNADLVKTTKWLRDHNITVRGHNIVWPGWTYLPKDMRPNSDNPAYLTRRINERVQNMMTLPGLKGVLSDWDVFNEITQNEDVANALAGTAGYRTGRELYVEMMKKAKQLDPKMVLYINDYTTLDQGNLPGHPLYERTKQYLKEIKDAGAPLDGIGFQAHMGNNLVSMTDVKTILDDFYQTFGARAKITEYDYGKLVNDSLAARYTADLLTMCFSHESMDGFLAWGFWQGAHWLDNAPFFNFDWTPRPAVQAVSDLMFNKWWTNSTLQTNAQGQAQIRGFKGKYKITVSYDGRDVAVDTIDLSKDLQLNISGGTVGTRQVIDPDFKARFANPAPAGSQLAMQFSEGPERIQLLNLQGQVLSQVAEPGPQFDLPLPAAKGIYVLNALLKGGRFWSGRLVVE
jgi:GH35 family endo-1,4-beta-xylanase